MHVCRANQDSLYKLIRFCQQLQVASYQQWSVGCVLWWLSCFCMLCRHRPPQYGWHTGTYLLIALRQHRHSTPIVTDFMLDEVSVIALFLVQTKAALTWLAHMHAHFWQSDLAYRSQDYGLWAQVCRYSFVSLCLHAATVVLAADSAATDQELSCPVRQYYGTSRCMWYTWSWNQRGSACAIVSTPRQQDLRSTACSSIGRA